MTIKQVMTFGCDTMNTAQRQEEKERRVNVVAQINKIGARLAIAEGKQKNDLQRKLNRIKMDEIVWLKEAAWFLY